MTKKHFKRLIDSIWIFCFWYEVVVGLSALVLNQWRKNWKTCCYVVLYMKRNTVFWNRLRSTPTHAGVFGTYHESERTLCGYSWFFHLSIIYIQASCSVGRGQGTSIPDSLPGCIRMNYSTLEMLVKWIHVKCFTPKHWVIYNVFIRRGTLKLLYMIQHDFLFMFHIFRKAFQWMFNSGLLP